jgi:ABC-type uncharacterized transport system substrate-binding protein
MSDIRRREFLALLGGAAAAWPLAAGAQQPLVGFLSSRSPEDSVDVVAAFRRGLGERGVVEGILREMVPATTRIAVLINPADAAAETMLKDVEAATRAMGLQIQVLNANTSHEIDVAFATFVRERPDALFVSGGPLLLSRRVQLALLAARYAVPTSYGARDYVEIGGLMSYGANVADAYRQVGVYAGRILKGAKPADLPVMQSTKFELVINAQAARVLGLTVPPTLLARADEVIE